MTALTADARGVYPIAPTPFFDDGRIDTASIDRLTDFCLGCDATGITVLGQLGEAPKLEHEESLAVATQMIRRAGHLPVVVGVSAPAFAAMLGPLARSRRIEWEWRAMAMNKPMNKGMSGDCSHAIAGRRGNFGWHRAGS